MTQGGETPGIGGVPSLSGKVVRAPNAWQHLLKVQFETIPDAVRRSQQARRSMKRLGRRG